MICAVQLDVAAVLQGATRHIKNLASLDEALNVICSLWYDILVRCRELIKMFELFVLFLKYLALCRRAITCLDLDICIACI